MHNRRRPWGRHCDRLLIYRRYPAAEAGLAELDEFLLGSPSLAAEARVRERMPPRPDPAADLVRVLCDARQRRAAAFKNLSLLAAPLSLRISASMLGMAVMLALAARYLPTPAVPAMVIVFIAASLSSVAGFAFSAICGALLFHVMVPVVAVQLMMTCSIAIQGFSVAALRNSIDWRVLSRLLLGGLLGIPAGVYLLLAMDVAIYCRLLGAFLISYGVFMILRPRMVLRFQRAWADGIAGLLGGITGGLAGFPGALVTIWCGLKGWDKDRQRGVYQPFMLVMQVLGLAAISVAAAGSQHRIPSAGFGALVYVPAALLGTWCGLGWYWRLSDPQFARAVNLLLIAAGAALAL